MSYVEELQQQKQAAIQAEKLRVDTEKMHQRAIEQIDERIAQARIQEALTTARTMETEQVQPLIVDIAALNVKLHDAFLKHDLRNVLKHHEKAIKKFEELYNLNAQIFRIRWDTNTQTHYQVANKLKWVSLPAYVGYECVAHMENKQAGLGMVYAMTGELWRIPSKEFYALPATVKDMRARILPRR